MKPLLIVLLAAVIVIVLLLLRTTDSTDSTTNSTKANKTKAIAEKALLVAEKKLKLVQAAAVAERAACASANTQQISSYNVLVEVSRLEKLATTTANNKISTLSLQLAAVKKTMAAEIIAKAAVLTASNTAKEAAEAAKLLAQERSDALLAQEKLKLTTKLTTEQLRSYNLTVNLTSSQQTVIENRIALKAAEQKYSDLLVTLVEVKELASIAANAAATTLAKALSTGDTNALATAAANSALALAKSATITAVALAEEQKSIAEVALAAKKNAESDLTATSVLLEEMNQRVATLGSLAEERHILAEAAEASASAALLLAEERRVDLVTMTALYNATSTELLEQCRSDNAIAVGQTAVANELAQARYIAYTEQYERTLLAEALANTQLQELNAAEALADTQLQELNAASALANNRATNYLGCYTDCANGYDGNNRALANMLGQKTWSQCAADSLAAGSKYFALQFHGGFDGNQDLEHAQCWHSNDLPRAVRQGVNETCNAFGNKKSGGNCSNALYAHA